MAHDDVVFRELARSISRCAALGDAERVSQCTVCRIQSAALNVFPLLPGALDKARPNALPGKCKVPYDA